MPKYLSLAVIVSVILLSSMLWYRQIVTEKQQISGAPPYGLPEDQVPSDQIELGEWAGWQRPAGPPKVTLQVGHWQNDQFPEELERLRGNTGASGGGKWEWEVNLAIAEELKSLLETQGIIVEILPATVPPDHWADVFLAIHADGNNDHRVRGYKFAGPWRDLTGRSDTLVTLLNDSYGEVTGMPYDPNVTRNMRGYYAFAWWRFEHSIHPMTTAAIAETGFLTSPVDRRVIVEQPELSARAMYQAIIAYLTQYNLLVT